MASGEAQFSGLNLAELLQVEAELCTPLKRKQWVDSASNAPHAVRAALLRDVYEKCRPKDLKMQHLAPVLEKFYPKKPDRWLKNKVYDLFSPKRPTDDFDKIFWLGSQELLATMLRGVKRIDSDDLQKRDEIVDRIVRFFFPNDVRAATPANLPPPFFRRERSGSDHCACPHDATEANFYAVSLARKYHGTDKLVRWYMSSGGDFLRGLSGPAFDVWAERITAALCFGLKLTFVVPVVGAGETPLHDYLKRLRVYWKTKLDLATLANRYPELHLKSRDQIERQALQNMITKEIPVPGKATRVDAAEFTDMFPFARSFQASHHMIENSHVYAPTFLNPWLRFHWVDLVSQLPQSCEPQFAAIAFNDDFENNNLVVLVPESMIEYLKWLSVFVGK